MRNVENIGQHSLATALAAFAQRDLAQAEIACREALGHLPREAQAHLLLGEILLASGQTGAAREAYERAAALFPGLGLPFTRLATICWREQHRPLLPREPDPNRRRLQMTSLGQRGRFGNQLLQYGFGRIYADRHGLEFEVPDWIGRDLYGLDDPIPSAQLPALNESQADFGAILRGESALPFEGRDISGYFCGDTRLWGEVANEFRALFRLVSAIRVPLEAELARLTANAGTLIAVHLRRGDFGQGRFWVAPESWYLEWLRALWPRLDRPVLYLATDGPAEAPLREFAPLTARDIALELPGIAFIADHFVLSRAQHLAISNSSFSFSAALLNDRLESQMRPDPVARRLVPFEAWRAPVLVDVPRASHALSDAERTVFTRFLSRVQMAVHVGSVNSPWTSEVRAQFPRLVVHEVDVGDSLDELRARLSLNHIEHLRIESARDLGRVIEGARRTLRYARVDCIELTTRPDQGAGRVLARLAELDYRGYTCKPNGQLQEIKDSRPRGPGIHVFVHERLTRPEPQVGAPMLDVGALAARHGVTLAGRGVVHVGAHEGQELPIYERLALRPIVLIEANPTVYARLEGAVGGRHGIRAVKRAVAAVAGTMTLHLASFDQSSSLLPMGLHRDVYPGIKPAGEISVQATPLDALLEELGLAPELFVLLHIDVQGAELEVLKGAEALLKVVELVSVEVNFAELYRGCAQIEALDDWLTARGFERAAMSSAYHPTWGDALYVRPRLSG